MKPVLALVGRPNVGKSTLFNRLTKSRDAIVADFAGLTRDRHYGNAKQGKHEFIVIDTGGFEPDATTGIFKEMAKQTRQAVAEADVVIFVVDAREGISAQDYEIAKYLRRLGKPCLLTANKSEGMVASAQLVEFFELGLGEANRRYADFLAQRIADGIQRANHQLAPAKIGWGSGQKPEFVFNRRWFVQAEKNRRNPFGGVDQVRMNPAPATPAYQVCR